MNDFTDLQTQLDKERRKVDVDHFDITIREIIRMTETNELHIAPDYQRKFRWKQDAESRLVESLFLGLPVPSVFVATNTDGTWELVDGLQRISTLVHYTASSQDALDKIEKEKPLRLSDLEKLTFFNDWRFEDLPIPIKLSFYKRSLRVTALSDKSDNVVRFDLFERLNTGGIALSPQEVRACIFRGTFAEFIRELSQDQNFQSMLKLQEKSKSDGTSEELVLKFFAYLFDRENFKGNVKGFLNDYMEKSTNDSNYEYDKHRELFRNTVNSLSSAVDGHFLRNAVHVTPINQFEAVMVGIGELILNGTSVKIPQKGWLEDGELVEHSTGSTNTRQKLTGRIRRAKELFSPNPNDAT